MFRLKLIVKYIQLIFITALILILPTNSCSFAKEINSKNKEKKKQSIIVASRNSTSLTFKKVNIKTGKSKVIKKITGIYPYPDSFVFLKNSEDRKFYFYPVNNNQTNTTSIIMIDNSSYEISVRKIDVDENKFVTRSLKDSFRHSFDVLKYRNTLFYLYPFSKVIINLDMKSARRSNQKYLTEFDGIEKKYRIIDIAGGAFVSKDKLVYVANTIGPGYTIQDRYILIIINSKSKLTEVYNIGYALVPTHYSEVFRNFEAPVEISSDGKQVAFITRYPNKNEKEFKPFVLPLYLTTFDLDKNKTRKIASLTLNYKKSLEWNPKIPNIIAVTDGDDNSEILLFNTDNSQLYNKKSGIKSANKIITTIHWSPDGKELGYMDETGKLFIFNLSTQKTRLIDSDRNNFDFFWKE